MKKKIFTSLFFALFLFGVAFIGASCSTDNSVDDIRTRVVNINVATTSWELVENEKETYYKAVFDLPELTTYVFDKGATVAYYKFNNNTKTTLPYVKTTKDNKGIPYTETYSCDFKSGNPSVVIFYLEASDAGKYDGNPPAARFQIVLVW